MSEVYIRSQNKEKLYRLGGNYACVEYGEYEDVKKKRGGGEVLEADGKIVGALGVSGGTAEQDTAIAAYGKQVFKEVLKCL